jgi:DNA processing protein
MNRTEALVALNMAADIGSIRLKKLLEHFGSPENIFRAPQEKLTAVYNIGEKTAAQISSFKEESLEKEFALAKKYGLKIITVDDKDYPRNLKFIPDPPLVLYVKGEISQGDRMGIAIVGSRRASFYGLSSAEKFSAELAQLGFTIVSGMARGIDSAAHRGALKARGRTLAVIGSGFGHIYPGENKKLAEEIAQHGAVISEFSVGTRPLRQNFPRRNRVISGLGLGVLVVEAARNSGALITADFALEQGREVFALPGKVDSANSIGTHALIQQGAKLVFCVEDILEEWNLPLAPRQDKMAVKKAVSTLQLTPEESRLFSLLSRRPLHLDEIAQKINLDIPRISDILLKLQFKKLVKQLPGMQFVRRLDEEEKFSHSGVAD